MLRCPVHITFHFNFFLPGDIPIQSLTQNKTSSNWMEIRVDFASGLECLLGKASTPYHAQVCWEKTAEAKNSCYYNWSNCKEFQHPGFFNITNLNPDTPYTFYAIVTNGTSEPACSPALIANTNVVTPRPLHSTLIFTTGKSKPLNSPHPLLKEIFKNNEKEIPPTTHH